MADDSSDLSSLSSLSPAPPDMDSELEASDQGDIGKEKGILKFFPKVPQGQKVKIKKSKAAPEKEPSPPPRRRSPSPPHEYILADNPDIAFLVMYRSRFNEAFPKSLSNFGPQELETDISDHPPGQRAENFLCAILGALLNRKQDVKPGHYMRALEEAINARKGQWPEEWQNVSPLSGSRTFNDMSTVERLSLLRTLSYWSLQHSEALRTIINKSYKQNRVEDDTNQPLSVQPWGSDSDRRRYYLVEGLDDTSFRVYRESNPAGFSRTWWSVAGSIEELTALAEKLETKDGGPRATRLAQRMRDAVPRFEATDEKRKRREYRQAQKNRFKRPESGFSMYEGRTRGKRVKYTYSDDEDAIFTDSTRRSARNTGTSTPAEPALPQKTSSGRQVRAPTRLEAENAESVQGDDESYPDDSSVGAGGRPRRAAATVNGRSSRSRGFSADEMEDNEPSEPELGDDEEEEAENHIPEDSEDDEDEFNEDEHMVDDDELNQAEQAEKKVEKPEDGAAATTAQKRETYSDKLATDETRPGEDDNKTKAQTPETEQAATTTSEANKPPPTPLQGTSLAFRGSPEKPPRQQQQQAVDVGSGH